jgi:hypothetical protein
MQRVPSGTGNPGSARVGNGIPRLSGGTFPRWKRESEASAGQTDRVRRARAEARRYSEAPG